MNHGANAAFAELFELGICTAGSVMVPCPWFLEVAEMQAKNPRLDIGVHLVLTSEFRTYRWRPLTGASQASGLVDARRLFLADGEGGARARASGRGRGRASRAGRGGEDGRHRHHPYRRAHVHCARARNSSTSTCRLGREERVPVLLVRQDAAYGNMQKGAASRRGDRGGRRRGAAGVRPRARDALAARRIGRGGLRCAASTGSGRDGTTWRSTSTSRARSPRSSQTPTVSAPRNTRSSGASGSARRLAGYELIGMRALRDELRARPVCRNRSGLARFHARRSKTEFGRSPPESGCSG